MEFSEISELNCFVGIAQLKRRKFLAKSRRQYAEHINSQPVFNLIDPSPYCTTTILTKGHHAENDDVSVSDMATSKPETIDDVQGMNNNYGSAIRITPVREIVADVVNEIISLAVDGKPAEEEMFDMKTLLKPQGCSVMTKLMQSVCGQTSKDARYITPPMESDPKRQSLVVHIFGIRSTLKITVSKDNTIKQITSHIFYLCLYGDSGVNVILPYNSFEGYELRLVDEDGPLFDIAPLDPEKAIGSFKIDAVAFCNKRDYVPKTNKKIRTFDVSIIIITVGNLKDANEIHMEKIAINQNVCLL